MSILIRGMEMPEKTYAHCMLIKDIDGSVELHVCTENSEYMSEWERYCLLPVPPHGRLIDADALAKNVTGAIYHSELRAAPTIIPAEEGE